MKIAFLGNFGVSFSSETHHKKSLEALGHEVIALQEGKALAEQVLAYAEHCDMFVWVHTHGWQTPTNFGYSMVNVLEILRDKGVPTVTYHLDLWFGLKRQTDLEQDGFYKHIQHFFTVDKKMAEWFNENTQVKGHYLPAGVFHEECYMAAPSQGKSHNDVIFVGSRGYHPEWPYRPQLIGWLDETYGTKFKHFGGDGLGVVRGDKLNQLYADTKISIGDSLCINFDYPYYWSDRVFETLGRGGFMIHPYIEGMGEYFENGKHLVFYQFGDFEQLRGLINYYLSHEEEREKIRRAGHEYVRDNHTYLNRWRQIIKEVCND